MNIQMLAGNVGQDPKVVQLEDGNKIAKFSLATNKSYRNASGERITKTTWHNIVAYRKLAEFVEGYVKKGGAFLVQGETENRSYVDKDGVTRYVTEVIASSISFAPKSSSSDRHESDGGEQEAGQEKVAAKQATVGSNSDADAYINSDDDDGLPF